MYCGGFLGRWVYLGTVTNQRDESTPRTRELGAALRRHRIAAGVPGQLIARRLNVSAGQITHVEKGVRALNDFDLATYLGMCSISREDLEALVHLAHEPDGHRVQAHSDQLPDALRTLIFLEATATGLENYEPSVIPGLAQTEDYMRALFMRGQRFRKPELIEAHVRARSRRQQMLNRENPPRLIFYVQEAALRTVIGDARIMHEQMISLLLLTAYPNYEINIIPAKTDSVGVYNGAFMLMRYGKHAPTAAVSSRTTTLFLDTQADLDEYVYVLDELSKISLTAGESREVLDRLSSEYGEAI